LYAEIVKAEVCDPCPFAGRFEGPFKRAHWLTTVQEDMLLMQRPRLVKLLEHFPQAWEQVERDQSPLPALGILALQLTSREFLYHLPC